MSEGRKHGILRYWAFAYQCDHPEDGWEDFVGSFASREYAEVCVVESLRQSDGQRAEPTGRVVDSAGEYPDKVVRLNMAAERWCDEQERLRDS